MDLLNKLFNRRRAAPPIVVVSGLPRSGTSMMMRMLEAGGLPPLMDGLRAPNDDNPLGYYEFERVKKLPEGDVGWLPEARGHAVKIIAALLPHLPDSATYRVLFMRRAMSEILASQRRMLIRRGEDADAVDDAEMARLFTQHLGQVFAWMDARPNVSYLEVDYNAMVADPTAQVAAITGFLGVGLDRAAMVAAVEPGLWRQRGGS